MEIFMTVVVGYSVIKLLCKPGVPTLFELEIYFLNGSLNMIYHPKCITCGHEGGFRIATLALHIRHTYCKGK